MHCVLTHQHASRVVVQTLHMCKFLLIAPPETTPRSIWDVCRVGRGGRKASRCWEDRRQPLCPALAGRGARDGDASPAADLPPELLPHDAEGHLLRPGVV